MKFSIVLTSTEGYDSVIVLNLTVKPYSIYEFNKTIFECYVYSELGFNNLSTSGTYSRPLTASNGCDSLVTLHLTVQPTTPKREDITISQR